MKRTEVEEVLKNVDESQRKAFVDGIMNLHTVDAESHKKEIEAKDRELSTKDTKINELANDVKKFDGVDVKELQESVSNWEKKYNKDLSDERKSNAIKLAVAKERPKNEKALMALLDTEIIKINDDGSVTGLKEQLETIKKENDFLFEVENPIDVDLGGNHAKRTPPKEFTLAEAIEEHYEEE